MTIKKKDIIEGQSPWMCLYHFDLSRYDSRQLLVSFGIDVKELLKPKILSDVMKMVLNFALQSIIIFSLNVHISLCVVYKTLYYLIIIS